MSDGLPLRRLPLAGLRVIEMGQLIAGPFAGKTFGEFGAEIIKIEPPGVGDPLRRWREMDGDTSLWWHVQSRNKKSVTLDLKQPEGQEIVRRLVRDADILIENFRPGTLEKWNLGYEALSAINPGLILVRISGFGQTGPYRDRPGFGVIGESMGGLRYLTAEPGRPPVRVGVSLGDSLGALYAVIGALVALRDRAQNGGRGQVVDVALYESVFAIMESLLPEYDVRGLVRQPGGGALPGITPSNSYPCREGRYVLIAGNGDSIFKRLMRAIGRADLADDPRFEHNDGRTAHATFLDDAIGAWTRERPLEEVLAMLERAEVPAGNVFTVADIASDPHYAARGMIEAITLPGGGSLRVPGIVPKLSDTPGRVGGPGPALGQHTDEILARLGFDELARADLQSRNVI